MPYNEQAKDRARKFFEEGGPPLLVAGALVDITERKLAEEAMCKSEENALRQLAYVEAIYATAPVGLCFVDTEQRFLSINKRLAEINGKTVEERLGRTVREVLPGLADMIEPRYRRVIETGEPVWNIEMSAAMADQPGVVRHFILSYYPIKNNDGQVLGVNHPGCRGSSRFSVQLIPTCRDGDLRIVRRQCANSVKQVASSSLSLQHQAAKV